MPPTKITPPKQVEATPAKAPRPKAKAVNPNLHRAKRAKRASATLKLIADANRLQVVLVLTTGEQHVGALCERLGQSQPAVSHHLAMMRHGGVVAPRREGKHSYYGLTELGQQLATVAGRLTEGR